MPIISFADRTTLAIFEGRNVKGIGHQIAERAQVKLALLDGAVNRAELATPGADLKGERHKWQMRVNNQYRIRFNIVRDEPLEVADVWFGDPH